MFPSILGTNLGPTFLCTALVRISWVDAMVSTPDMAVPITMPHRSDSAGRVPSPASSRASFAATKANCVNASVSRIMPEGM